MVILSYLVSVQYDVMYTLLSFYIGVIWMFDFLHGNLFDFCLFKGGGGSKANFLEG